MPVNVLKTQADGMLSFIGGQDSGRSPNLLGESQSFELFNSTVRGGRLKPRPGFDRITLSFPTDEIEDWFLTKKNQGDIVFNPINGRTVQVWSVGGRFFSIVVTANSRTGTVTEITPTMSTTTTSGFTVPAVGSTTTVGVADADLVRVGYPVVINGKNHLVTSKSGSTLTIENIDDTPAAVISSGAALVYLDPNSEELGISYMVEADGFLIAQDGLSKAFIFDGGNSRRADPAKQEVPTGTVMAYGVGRLWVAIGGGKFVGSDIIYGPSGTAEFEKRDAILKFTENTFLAGGGAFTAPGTITAMAFISSLDVSTGQGPLVVFTDSAIVSVNAPADREAWASMTNPIQTISLLANGAMSFYGTVPTVNGDIFYRSIDGLRSFFLARREFGTWGNTPISSEISTFLEGDAEDLLRYQSAIVFDNRLLFTGKSFPVRYGAKWQGIGALDFDNMSAMLGKSAPVYDGVWTGVEVVFLFTGKYRRTQRAFIAAINSDGQNELWEISKKHQFDNGTSRIRRTMVSRSFKFASEMEMVRLHNLEMFVTEVIGDCDITVRYRPDEYPCWFSWNDQPICANFRKCVSWANCATPTAFRGGYKTRIPFGQPPDTDETNDGKPARLGYTHQLEVVIDGYCEIQKLRVIAQQVDEEPDPRVDLVETCQEISCCPTDYYEWTIEAATDAGGEA